MKRKSAFHFLLLAFATFFIQAAGAQTYTVIHNFSGMGTDGSYPLAGVTLRNGILYGATHDGGAGCGMVYLMTHSGSDWTFVPIYVFQGENYSDGCAPFARPVFGPDGHLYGTAFASAGYGVVFELSPPASAHCVTAGCYWIQTVLHSFRGGSDGANPEYGDLAWDQQGSIYGTTSGSVYGGTVFQLTKSGNNWTNTTLYHFNPSTESYPTNGVLFDSSGNLYSTTQGLVFKLANPGWAESVLQTLGGDLGGPTYAGLIMDASGNLYGTTNGGGSGGAGTVFELSPVGNSYVATVLYNFSGSNGCGPYASLTMDAAGNLYGTTYCLGKYSAGSIFKMTKTGDTWDYTTLHDCTYASGQGPVGPVTVGADGTLYGTASIGGLLGNNGVVWMIKPQGNSRRNIPITLIERAGAS